MVRSRIFSGLSIVFMGVLLFGAVGWCGPAPAPGGPGAGGQYAPGLSAAGAAGGEGAAGAAAAGLGVTAGAGSSSGDGSNGGSPGVPLSDLGLKEAFTYLARIQYSPTMFKGFRISGDWLSATLTGSNNNYSGPLNPLIPAGSNVEAKMAVNLLTGNADFGAASLLGANSFIDAGPRLQIIRYADELSYTATGAASHARQKANFMIGFGFAGTFDFGGVSSTAKFLPRVNFAATVGKGSDMRYFAWEVFFEVYKTASTVYSGSRKKPTFAASIGFMRYNFAESVQSDNVLGEATGDVRYSLNVPVYGTATLNF